MEIESFSEKSLLFLANDKQEVVIFELNHKKCEFLTSFESFHMQKITCFLPIFEENALKILITCGLDKQIKVFSFNSVEKSFTLLHQSSLPKKITKGFMVSPANDVYFCDKYGDIYSFNPKNLSPSSIKFECQQIMGNLATITIFSRIFFENSEYLFLGDEYYRMKICKFPEIYEILSIWIPFERTPVSLALLNSGVIILFKSGEIDEKTKENNHKIQEKTHKNEEISLYNIQFIDRFCLEKEDFCGKELSFASNIGGRLNEKLRIFTINPEKSLFGLVSQHDIGEGVVEIEVFLVNFEENNKNLLIISKKSFKNKGKVKFIGVFSGVVVLQCKEKAGFVEKNQENSMFFEEKGCGFYTVNLF